MRHHIVGLQCDGFFITGARRLKLRKLLQRVGAVEIKSWIAGLNLNCLSNQIHRALKIIGLRGDHSKHVQRGKMIWLCRKYLLIHGLRLRQLTRLMQRQRLLKIILRQIHSTVTLLARLRGLSTSFPRSTAAWYANSCNGITVTNGCKSSGTSGT